MLQQCLKGFNYNAAHKGFALITTAVPRVTIPAQTILFRQASNGYAKQKTNMTTANAENNEPQQQRTFNRQYVDVDTPFAHAHKYTYAMPDDPYVASERVARILNIGTVDDAADYIKALPLYLQSPVVWNQIIGYCSEHGRGNYAEKYYIQMRKRGISPNERTFTHILSSYAHSTSPTASQQAETWFAKMKNDFDIQPTLIHINNLMRAYNNSDEAEKTIEMLKTMSSNRNREGVAPDAITYTIAFQACPGLRQRDAQIKEIRHIWYEVLYRLERHQRSGSNSSSSTNGVGRMSHVSSDNTSSLSKKAAQVILPHEDLDVHLARNKELEIDDTLIASLLRAVTRTASADADKLIVVEAMERLYSLCPPTALAMMKRNGVRDETRKYGFGFRPSIKVLDAMLRFCGGVEEFKLGKEYFELAKAQYPGLKVDDGLMNSLSFIERKLKSGRARQSQQQSTVGGDYKDGMNRRERRRKERL